MREETNAEIAYRFLGSLAIILAIIITHCFDKVVGG